MWLDVRSIKGEAVKNVGSGFPLQTCQIIVFYFILFYYIIVVYINLYYPN